MKIGVDCQKILNQNMSEGGGIAHYLYELICEMINQDQNNEFVLFFNSGIDSTIVNKIAQNSNVRAVVISNERFRIPVISSHFIVARIFEREKCDTYFWPTGIIPLGFRGRSVITIHDLAILFRPEWFNESRITRFFSTRILLPSSIRKARRIIVPSKNTKKDLSVFFPKHVKRSRVVYEGVSVKSGKTNIFKKYGINKNYFLFIGTIEPRKNISGALLGFEIFLKDVLQEIPDAQFVIAGNNGWKNKSVYETAERINKRFDRQVVRFIGYVDDDVKWSLYSNAIALIFPSFYEGFGLPVAEAMAIGLPVITSKNGSLKEVCGNTVLYSDNPTSIAGSMATCLLNKQKTAHLSRQSIKRSKRFSWPLAAKQTLRILESTLD